MTNNYIDITTNLLLFSGILYLVITALFIAFINIKEYPLFKNSYWKNRRKYMSDFIHALFRANGALTILLLSTIFFDNIYLFYSSLVLFLIIIFVVIRMFKLFINIVNFHIDNIKK